mgnify:CR=1 FL=1
MTCSPIPRPMRRALAVVLSLSIAVASLARCGPTRSMLVDVDPTTPARGSCIRGAWRCNGLVPEHCDTDEDGSPVTRWWPAHGLGADHRPAPCATRCVVDGEPAVGRCAGGA